MTRDLERRIERLEDDDEGEDWVVSWGTREPANIELTEADYELFEELFGSPDGLSIEDIEDEIAADDDAP